MLNAVIEIAIGLVVLYSLLSLMCSKTNELLANILSLRARNLRRAIHHLVGDTYVIKVYEHPMIMSLYRSEARPEKGLKRLVQSPGPSYLPAEKFVIALLDSTCRTAVTADPPLPPDPGDRLEYALTAEARDGEPPAGPPGPLTPSSVPAQVERDVTAITAEIDRVTDERLKRSLETLWRAASHNVVTFRAGVEQWFDHTMDRASGWYKRLAQTMALGLGLIVAVALNVDTVHITQRLWSDGPLRSAVLEQVKKLPPPATAPPATAPPASAASTTTTAPTTTAPAGANPPPTGPTTTVVTGAPATPPATLAGVGDQVGSIQDDLSRVESLQLPIGWGTGQRPQTRGDLGVALLGWVLTALALSLGAPFWFDILNKVTSLRGGGTKESTPTQAAKGVK